MFCTKADDRCHLYDRIDDKHLLTIVGDKKRRVGSSIAQSVYNTTDLTHPKPLPLNGCREAAVPGGLSFYEDHEAGECMSAANVARALRLATEKRNSTPKKKQIGRVQANAPGLLRKPAVTVLVLLA
jgi:hypothetical protein